MEQKPKAKEVVHSLKEHTESAVKDKVQQAGIKSKDHVLEQVKEETTNPTPAASRRTDSQSAESYATDRVEDSAQNMAENTAYTGVHAVKYGVQKAREHHAEQQNVPTDGKPSGHTEGTIRTQSAKPEANETASSQKIKQKEAPTVKEKADTAAARVKEKPPDVKTRSREIKAPDTLPIKEKEEQHPQIQKQIIKTKDAPDVKTTDSSKAGHAAANKGRIETQKDAAASPRESVKKKQGSSVKKPDHLAAKDETAAAMMAPNARSGKANSSVGKRTVPKQRTKTPPKLHQKPDLQNVRLEKPMVKTPPAELKQIKQGHTSTQRAARTIKTVSETTKAAERSAATAAKKTAQAAKQTEERTRQAARVSKKTAQNTKRVVEQAVKGSVQAVKSLAELLGVSAPVVLLIIIVCLIAAIGGTCFGIFLSNDKSSGSEMTMAQAITELTTDYYDSITKFQAQYNYDDLEVKGSTSISWKDVLTIYAVKYTNDSDGFDVVTLDKKKLKKIKQILLDMNPCTGVVVEKIVPATKTFTNSSGQKVTTTTYETQKVLIVTAVHVSAKDQAKLYDFSDDAKAQVKELLSSDYDELWNEVIGSSGEIIVSSSTHVPNFIFAWPLDGDYRISSGFGTRTDPINGVVKTHGGTDIAAAQGTPILAAAGGTVEIAGYNAGGYGYYVKLSHGEGYETLYGHCSVLLVSTGQTVKQGQVIAKVGSTGHSTGPHLHFEVRYNGNKVNPMQFFQ